MRRQILRRKQIRLIPQIASPRHPRSTHTAAGTPAHTARDSRSPAQRFAGQTLPGIRHTQCPMHEHFQRHRRRRGDLPNILNRQLPRQHHPLHPQRPHKLNPARLGQRHLRRSMNRQRSAPSDESAWPAPDPAQSPHRRPLPRSPDVSGSVFQLIRKDQRVERQEPAHIVIVQIADDLWQFFQLEILRPMPRVEILQPKIDRIRAIGDRGFECIPIASGREELGDGLIPLVQAGKYSIADRFWIRRCGFSAFPVKFLTWVLTNITNRRTNFHPQCAHSRG